MILAELRAEVVKIESRTHPEILRTYSYEPGPPRREPSGVPQCAMYAGLSRSTLGLSIEMANPQGRDLFRRLAAHAHVVIENFGLDVMAGWECAFDDLITLNPSLLMLSLSGYGRTGRRAAYRAYASNISNFTGLTALTGSSHGTHTDYLTAEHGTVAVLAGLAEVARTGSGVHLDVAQIEAVAAVMAPVLLDALVNGRDVAPCGNEVPGALLAGAFPSAVPNKPVVIELENLADWATLCAVLDRADLSAESIDDAARNRGPLAEAFAEWAAVRSPFSATHLLQKKGLAVGTVYDNEDLARDPQLRYRDAVVEIDHPDIGRVEGPQSPHRLSATPGRMRWRGPRLGEHTGRLLRDWLGMPQSEIDHLEALGALFQAGP